MNKRNVFIICLMFISALVLSSCTNISSIISDNLQTGKQDKETITITHSGKTSSEENSDEKEEPKDNTSEEKKTEDNDAETDNSVDTSDEEIIDWTNDEETYDWNDDEVVDWNDDDEYYDWYAEDEIIDPDEFEEIPWVSVYEYGDWTMGDLEDGTWSAWRYNGSDETVTVPSTYNGEPVKAVGVWAFRDNKTLKHVIIPEGITVINENCFMGCENLEIAELPSHLDFFGDQIFSDCSSLKRCVVPDGVTELDYRQFDDCTSLEEVVLPSGMTLIGEHAFRNCYNLKTIYFRGSESEWASIYFYNNALSESEYTVVYNYDGD